MRLTNKRLVSFLAVPIIVIMIGTNTFPYIWHNGSGDAYGTDGGSSISGVSSIDTYLIEILVIEGAGHYLEANTAFQKLLGIVELKDFNGIDMEKYGNALKDAIVSMENASAVYDLLIWTAVNSPYNPEVQEKLAVFDYQAFEEEKGLNSVVLKKVEGFLKQGDITGVFKANRASFVLIIDQLYSLKPNGTIKVDLEKLWKMNEIFAETSLFGSYVARIFAHINAHTYN